jgi:hypothetical protein
MLTRSFVKKWRSLNLSSSVCMSGSLRSETCAKTTFVRRCFDFLPGLASEIRNRTPRVPSTYSQSTDCMISW